MVRRSIVLVRFVLVGLVIVVAAELAALSPPQYTLQRKLTHSVGDNAFVSVGEVEETGGRYFIDIVAARAEVAEGLSFILRPEYNIGGIEVRVTVLDEYGQVVVADESTANGSSRQVTQQHFANALGQNPLFVSFIDSFPLASFVVEIRPEVIQFWNDNLGDPSGNSNELATSVFTEVCRTNFFDDQVSVVFSTAQKSADPGHREGIIPVAAHGPGRFESFWTTELWLQLNGSHEVHLWFNPADSGGGEPLYASLTTTGNEPVLHLDDVVASLFLTEGSGSIRYWAETPIQVLSRTWTPATSGGTYGQTIRGVAVDAAGWTSSVQGDPLQLVTSHRDGYRVNLGLVNTSSSSATVQYALTTAGDRQLAAASELTTVELAPWAMIQVNDLLAGLPASQEELLIEVWVSSGAGTIMAYLCEVDSLTNDSSYQQARS